MALYTRPNNPELDAVKVPSALDIAWAAGKPSVPARVLPEQEKQSLNVVPISQTA
jgi:hypothetical protein